MKMKKIYICLALAALALGSCDDFLDKTPVSKIDSEKFFENEKQLQIYANGLYFDFTPSATDLTTDGAGVNDYIARSSDSEFLLPSYTVNKEGGWTYSSWKNLFRVNYFLEHINKAKGTCSAEQLNHYRGIARFWRAYFYFDKVKTYSDVPWYSNTIDANDTTALFKTRDSRELVMDSVLADINFACENIQDYANTSVTRWMALGMKSRICLYEGTYRKYHSVNPSTNQPWKEANGSTRYLEECVKASEEIMNSGKFSLYNTGKPESDYHYIFLQETPVKQEIIWAKEYNSEYGAMHDLSNLFVSPGNNTARWSPTQEFVNTYLNRDGTRFTDDANYKTKTFAQNFENRDYRLAQSMMPPGYTKKVGSVDKLTVPSWNVSMTGYQIIKWSIPDEECEGVGRSYNSISIIRYGEILLNEAEAKAELGQMTTAIWDKTIRLLRERAGVKGDAPTSADPYMEAYFDNTVTDPWILEIRRERGIELFFECGGMRYNDLMRWGQGKIFEHPYGSIYIGQKGKAIDSNGDGKVDLEVVDKAPSKKTSGITYIDLSNTKFYEWSDTEGRLYRINNYKWEDKKYVHPLPVSATVNNPNLKQNYGWK